MAKLGEHHGHDLSHGSLIVNNQNPERHNGKGGKWLNSSARCGVCGFVERWHGWCCSAKSNVTSGAACGSNLSRRPEVAMQKRDLVHGRGHLAREKAARKPSEFNRLETLAAT
jgi:hypothetical protein